MIKLLQLNNLKRLIFFLFLFYFFSIHSFSADDIWKKKENEEEQNIEAEDEITIKSPILSDSITKIEISIDEEEIQNFNSTLVGIFDPEENNFTLDMWSRSDGEDIKKIL